MIYGFGYGLWMKAEVCQGWTRWKLCLEWFPSQLHNLYFCFRKLEFSLWQIYWFHKKKTKKNPWPLCKKGQILEPQIKSGGQAEKLKLSCFLHKSKIRDVWRSINLGERVVMWGPKIVWAETCYRDFERNSLLWPWVWRALAVTAACAGSGSALPSPTTSSSISSCSPWLGPKTYMSGKIH